MSAAIELPQIGATGVNGGLTAPIASLTAISKRYANGILALDRLSFDLNRGEIVALLGPNGAGKSTAVKLLMGLTSPTSGTAVIFGCDPRHNAARLRTGVMLQVGRAPEMLKVREQIELFRGYYPNPMTYADIVKAAALGGIEERMFGQLSGGQKQRLLFALALAGDPDLLFLDEPTTGLDIESRRSMWAQIRSLAGRGKTVLLTTHYLEEADALAHRIVVINKGRIVCEGAPNEVKSLGATAPGTLASRSAKIIRCTTALAQATILNLQGVSNVSLEGSVATIVSAQPESTLREMLALDQTLHGLEVQSPALEDAFLALTADRA